MSLLTISFRSKRRSLRRSFLSISKPRRGDQGATFPGVDKRALWRPPGRCYFLTLTLADGTVVKWCSECECWGDHLCVEHNPENAVDADIGQLGEEGAGAGDELNVEGATGITADDTPEISDVPFTCLRLEGLL